MGPTGPIFVGGRCALAAPSLGLDSGVAVYFFMAGSAWNCMTWDQVLMVIPVGRRNSWETLVMSSTTGPPPALLQWGNCLTVPPAELSYRRVLRTASTTARLFRGTVHRVLRYAMDQELGGDSSLLALAITLQTIAGATPTTRPRRIRSRSQRRRRPLGPKWLGRTYVTRP
jgi:hypothetical protein